MGRKKEKGFTGMADVKKMFKREGRWLKIPATNGKLVAIGDLHGDGKILNRVLERFYYGSDDYVMIFLGDYVDREPTSWEDNKSAVVDKLLTLKRRYPNRIFLIAGNHDLTNRLYASFYSDFWDSLSDEEHDFYSDVLTAMPLVATTENGVAFCHATLPLDNDFSNFDLTNDCWIDTIWADYHTPKSASSAMRPVRLVKDFNKSMSAFNSTVLIHGHRPTAPLTMYRKRLITLQSNRFYEQECGIHVAVVNLAKTIKNSDDIEIMKLTV